MPLLIAAIILLGCLLPGAADLGFRVVDPQRAAVAGAVLEIRTLPGDQPPVKAVTDQSGGVHVSCEPPARIRLSATGFDPLVHRRETSAADVVTLRPGPDA